MLELTIQQARHFILAKQGLIGAYRFSGKDGAYEFIRQAGCIQFDPVDVCGKNAELTLQSRVKGFQKKMLQELLYADRKLVDYPDKELSIWPLEDWPWFDSYRKRSQKSGESFEGLERLEKEAIAYINENGPVCSDTLPIEGEIFWHSSMHWSGNWHRQSPAARSVLEQLYTDGVLIIHHKKGSRKYYDLAEKHIPSEILNAASPYRDEEEFLAWRILRRIGAVGLLWDKNSPAFLGINVKADQRKKVLSELTESGKVIPVTVEGIKAVFYYLAKDEPLMQEVLLGQLDLKPRLSFIAPLDPLMWDKELIFSIWGFRYAWEIYTPAVKRKFGYYTLPVVFGDRFVGRIEAVPDRKEGTLNVNGIWWEPDVRKTKKLRRALGQSLLAFGRFNNCRTVEIRKELADTDAWLRDENTGL